MQMTEQEAKVYVKSQLDGWLRSQGINTSKPFRCLHPSHMDVHASMSCKNNRVKCFACGFSGDLFDILALQENLTGRAVFERAYELFGVQVTDSGRSKKSPHEYRRQPALVKTAAAPDASFAEYISSCAARIDQTNYFSKRGISREVALRFGLGFDPEFRRGTGKNTWQAAIIPNGGAYIARNTDPNADDSNRYRKAGKSSVFNHNALYEEADHPVWIVEGEIDALSIESVGGSACALGSVSNADQLIRMAENRRPLRRLIIAMDADKAGETCKEKLASEFSRLNLEYMIAPADVFSGKKDANEALIADAEAFTQAVVKAEERFDTSVLEEEQAAAEAYHAKYSAFAQLDAFLGALTVNTPCVPTGFASLNDALDGGLYPGLIVLGAVSSAGKTTFTLQMADAIAAQGTDVLIFSLEMSARELMAKSISRITLKKALDGRRNPALAKSARDITVADRYSGYDDEELLLIDEAIQEYCRISGNIFIIEGMGDVGVDRIRAQVQEHIDRRKRTPVVIVDYLQLLAPSSERLTDKQATDKNVLELRRIARDYNLPLIAISSFNRAHYRSAASLSSFKESGGVEYSADVLLALQYARVGEESFDLQAAMQQNPRWIDLLILKNRSGKTGTKISLRYYPRNNYFDEH